ncbi:hypothetical protein ACFL1X_01310 [Candidatus Hydrogenedentota bacterium]
MVKEVGEKETSVVHWIGIDVSKRRFDAALVRIGQKWPTTPCVMSLLRALNAAAKESCL